MSEFDQAGRGDVDRPAFDSRDIRSIDQEVAELFLGHASRFTDALDRSPDTLEPCALFRLKSLRSSHRKT